MTPVVAAIAGDPGGANALAPALETLRREGRAKVFAFGYREAAKLWKDRGLEPVPARTGASLQEVVTDLRSIRANLVLTGTSYNDVGLEHVWILAARRAGVPSLALLDYWSHYRERFLEPRTQEEVLPDIIAVMDEHARAEAAGAGLPSARLRITGQPAWDGLADSRRSFSRSRRTALRRRIGAQRDDLVVLFVSQPLAAAFGTTPRDPHYLGYTERDVMQQLTAALAGLADERKHPILLLVRPHPREDPGAHRALVRGRLRVLPTADHPPRDLAMAADLVVGMNTAFLVESYYLGTPTVSLQPGLRRPETLPLISQGRIRCAQRAARVTTLLEEALFSSSGRTVPTPLPEGGTAAVCRLVYEMMGLEPASVSPKENVAR